MSATDGSPSAVTAESLALFAGAAGFLVMGVVGLIAADGEPVPLSGRGSAGATAAGGAAILGAAAVVAGIVVRRRSTPPTRRVGGTARDVFDIAALAIAHACVFLIGTLALFSLLSRSFLGAVLFPFASAVIVGVVGAVSVYFAYLSAVNMNIYRLAALLAVFLSMGVLSSMLTAEDPLWWQKNLSALGMGSTLSGFAFNFTLIVGGLMVTIVASFATRELEIAAQSKSPKSRRRVRLLQSGLVLMGILLACVGLFPVDENLAVHNTVASGMVTVFAALIISMAYLVPAISRAFVVLGFVFLGVIVGAAVAFAQGYYNLTATELIAAFLIFSWLIILIRNLGAVDADHLDEARVPHPRYRRTDTAGIPTIVPGKGAPVDR
ncbi:MAG: hypothetical protein ABWX92_01115 [Mycetocola sp.]